MPPFHLKGSVYFSTPEDTTYISLDNLTALSALSQNYAAKIYAETKRQWLRYDNLNPEKPSWSRIQQPRDIIFYVLKLARKFNIPEIAFASTSAIYGDLKRKLTEDIGPLFPISNYGAMKLAGEAAISAATESFLKRALIFRFPNVVGSRATHGAILDFVHKLKKNPAELEVLGDGKQAKPYFLVADLIEAMLFIEERAPEKLNFYNIGTSDTVTNVRYLAEATIRCASPQAKIRFTGGQRGWVGDVPQVDYSVEKLAGLGWRPRLTSNEAVDRAVAEIVAENR